MTIAIPIVTSFDGKGISSAVKEFKNLETNGEKAQFAIKKAAVPAAAALAGLTAATTSTGGLFYGTQSGADRKFTLTATGASLTEGFC